MNLKSMVIKESQLTKLRLALDYRVMEAKNLFLQELLGVAHSIALTPTSIYHAKNLPSRIDCLQFQIQYFLIQRVELL